MGDSLNRQEVEKFLLTTTRGVMTELPKEVTSSILNQLGTKLVEVVNSNLSNTCPSTEGFKFVVHATVQEQWGQGSLVGAQCEWDNTRDQVVSVDHKTDKHPLVNEYITKVVASMKKYLSNPDADADGVDIVLSAPGGHVDRFRLEFGSLAGLSTNSSASVKSDQFMVELEMTLASFLLRLAQATAGMSSSQEEREWWVELGTTEQGAMRLMEGDVWCLAETDKGGGGDIVPVMVAQIPLKMQLYVQSSKGLNTGKP